MGANALAAYSYMALVPLIQPPVMRLLTTDKERRIVMKNLRKVSKREKILFPLIAAGIIALIIPAVVPLMGMFMFGNLMKESGVVGRLTETAQGALMNIVTIFLGISVGATMQAEKFLSPKPLLIFGFGILDFAVCMAGGIWTVKAINWFLKPENKMNPLIGSAGVSAVPMSARVSQVEGLSSASIPVPAKKPGKLPPKPQQQQVETQAVDLSDIVLTAMDIKILKSIKDIFNFYEKKYEVKDLRKTFDSLEADGFIVQEGDKYRKL